MSEDLKQEWREPSRDLGGGGGRQAEENADAKARGWEGARNNEKASRAAGNSERDSERK